MERFRSLTRARIWREHARERLRAIVHAHSGDMFEVEFVQASGQTQALVTLPVDAIRAIQDGDLIAVRQVHQTA